MNHSVAGYTHAVIRPEPGWIIALTAQVAQVHCCNDLAIWRGDTPLMRLG